MLAKTTRASSAALNRLIPHSGNGEQAFETARAEDLHQPWRQPAQDQPAVPHLDPLANVDDHAEDRAADVVDLRQVDHPRPAGLTIENAQDQIVQIVELRRIQGQRQLKLDDVDRAIGQMPEEMLRHDNNLAHG